VDFFGFGRAIILVNTLIWLGHRTGPMTPKKFIFIYYLPMGKIFLSIKTKYPNPWTEMRLSSMFIRKLWIEWNEFCLSNKKSWDLHFGCIILIIRARSYVRIMKYYSFLVHWKFAQTWNLHYEKIILIIHRRSYKRTIKYCSIFLHYILAKTRNLHFRFIILIILPSHM